MDALAPVPLDEPQLAQLYERLERRVYNVVYRWLWNEAEAADTVQEAFLRLWDRRDEVRVETVEALVFRIAVNLAARRRRAKTLWRWVSLEAMGSSEPSREDQLDLEEHQQAHQVRTAVEALPERLRRVIVLCELSGLSYAEVGQVLQIPEGTVGSRRHKALALLRQSLGTLREGEHVAQA